MTPKNNLIPTPIVDKNGRLTTVHKRQEVAGKENITLPSPVVTEPKRSKQDMISGIIEEMREMDLCWDGDETESATSTLGGYSTSSLLMVEDALQKDAESASLAGLLVNAGESQVLVSEALLYMPQMVYKVFWDAVRQVKTLHGFYPTLPPCDDYSKADEYVQQQCAALLKVTSAVDTMARDGNQTMKMTAVGNKSDRVAILSDSRLIEYVIDHPQSADQIVDLIEDRGVSDYRVIHAVLHSESLALSNGML